MMMARHIITPLASQATRQRCSSHVAIPRDATYGLRGGIVSRPFRPSLLLRDVYQLRLITTIPYSTGTIATSRERAQEEEKKKV